MVNVTYCSHIYVGFRSFKLFLCHRKISPNQLLTIILYGAYSWTRTSDLFLTKEVLYRLSYVGKQPQAANFSSNTIWSG